MQQYISQYTCYICSKYLSRVKEVNEIESRLQQKKRENKLLDKRIQMLNMDVNHQTMMRDVAFEEKEVRQTHHRLVL